MRARILVEPDFAAWREQARLLFVNRVHPDTVDLAAAEAEEDKSLSLQFEVPPPPFFSSAAAQSPKLSVPRPFLDLAAVAACHASADRWNLLYRLLWRLQDRRDLLHDELDPDVGTAQRMAAQVRRDLHKMHAFVRFCRVEEPLPSGEMQERYIAWYRPDHRILALAVPFFAERFSVMHWTILTPYAAASWDATTKQVTWGPGVPRSSAPAPDELASVWASYYASIFNPARLNTRAMRAEMPVRFWENMPELQRLPELLQQSDRRVGAMMEQQDTAAATSYVPLDHALPVLAEAIPHCRGCELYRYATQPVFGAGPGRARLMLIGEQPGDEEDRRGAPFVGPAGKVFDRALAELGIDRAEVYITNAVKHFKFIERGKRRIHESPKLRELSACRPWLLAELDAVRPQVVVCLGASAAKSLLGAKFALMKERGKLVSSPYIDRVVATLHPSAILRAQDETTSATLYQFMKQDIAFAAERAGLSIQQPSVDPS